jgi:hypothetical protein
MALEALGYSQTAERWDAQNLELERGSHTGTLFEFRCWETKNKETGEVRDWVCFGFQVGALKVQRFYGLISKAGKPLAFLLERDLKTLLGSAPPVSEVQVAGRTGPVVDRLVGLQVQLAYEEREGYLDLYINGVVESSPGGDW